MNGKRVDFSLHYFCDLKFKQRRNADCKGIEKELVLNKELTYSIKIKYLGKREDKVFEENGIFVWDKTGGSIILLGLKGRPSQYKVGENKLIQLDNNCKAIIGALAEKYVLVKE